MLVKTIGPADAKIMLVGEAPGETEAREGKPFIGNAGRVLNELLSIAGISRHECLIANVARERPPGNKVAFFFEDSKMTVPKPILKEWIALLKHEIEMYQPNIVIALGATAIWALTGKKGIKSLRGYICESSLIPGQKVIPTYHPQKTDYEYKLRFQVVMDLRKAKKNSTTRDLPVDNRLLHSSPSRNEFIEYLKFLYFDHKEPVALDLEVVQPGSHIDIIGVADSPRQGMSYKVISGRKAVHSFDKELEIWHWLAKVCTKPLIMHNGSYDMGVLWYNNNIYTNLFADTMVAVHICWPETPRSLDFVTSVCLNVPPWKDTAETFPTMYNCSDAVNTYGVWRVLEKEIENPDSMEVFKEEMAQIEPATFLQLQGLKIDMPTRAALLESIDEKLEVLDLKLEQEFGKEVNLRSPKQLQNLLYEDLGLPIQYKRRKSVNDPRKRTADAEALIKLSRKANNPVLLKIVEWKKLDKLKNTFVLLQDKKTGKSKISPEGKVHTSYNVTGATMSRVKKGLVIDDEDDYKSFGRWSSSKSIILPYGSGNLQNIPHIARQMYKAPKGYEFIQADYIQAEAVVVSYLINDQKLIDLFKRSFGKSRQYRKENFLDVHIITAASMFRIELKEVTDAQRKPGKVLRHANSYIAGPAVTAHELGCSISEAKKLNQIYHLMCPQLGLWHKKLQRELQTNRTLTNLFGRKHRFLERWGDELFRSAASYIPQSTVGDLLNRSLVKFYHKYGDKRTIVLQLHDAMYILSPLGAYERQDTIEMCRDVMLHPLQVPGEEFIIDVDFAAGPSWGELEKL